MSSVIELAVKSGLINKHNEHLLKDEKVMFQIERFVALVRSESIEEAASVCEKLFPFDDDRMEEAAKVIRSLK